MADLIAKVEKEYQAGQENYTAGHLEAARQQLSSIEPIEARLGTALGTGQTYGAVGEALRAVDPATSGDAAIKAFNPVADAVQALITQIGNGSNLILDPDLDSFYVMDTWVVRVPALVDVIGRVGDRAAVLATASVAPTSADRIELALANGNVDTTAAAVTTDLKTAFDNTADARLEPALTRRWISRPRTDAFSAFFSLTTQESGSGFDGTCA